MFKFSKFVEWAFYGLVAYFAYSIDSNIKTMSLNINELNKQMAVQIADNQVKQHLIEDHESRIRIIESKIK